VDTPVGLPFRGLQLNADGTLLYSAGLDGLICVWDVATGTQKANATNTSSVFSGYHSNPMGID
jgi:WD40 repeat protein